jgi:hypothetical protein
MRIAGERQQRYQSNDPSWDREGIPLQILAADRPDLSVACTDGLRPGKAASTVRNSKNGGKPSRSSEHVATKTSGPLAPNDCSRHEESELLWDGKKRVACSFQAARPGKHAPVASEVVAGSQCKLWMYVILQMTFAERSMA